MLSLLVEAAIHWMEIGLLLQVLKIVIYQKDLKQVKDDPMLKAFASLKQKWMKEQAGRSKASQVHPFAILLFCSDGWSPSHVILGCISYNYHSLTGTIMKFIKFLQISEFLET